MKLELYANEMPFPLLLVFVVIIMTPSLARDPYNADAAAPFKTVIASISSGLILLKPSPPSEVLLDPFSETSPLAPLFVLSIGTPFTTINGELFPPKED